MQLASTHNSTLSRHQKVMSILLIMLMSVLPMLSASASIFQCQHSSSLGKSSVEKHDMSNMQISGSSTLASTMMGDLHDCCEEANGQCDCDNGQVGSSLINTVASVVPTYNSSLFKQAIQPLLVSKIPDSLYRPPINTSLNKSLRSLFM